MSSGSTPDLDALRVHEGLVRSVVRAVLRGDDRVEDVVQETWIASGRAGPRDPAAAKGWLARVARRFALGLRRADASRARREREAFHDAGAPSALEIAEREETRRLVVDALLAVEEPFRSALVLRYYEGLPPRAIAARLGVPAETARSRVRRGLERMRERLVADGDPRRRRRLAVLATAPAAATALWIGGTAMTLKAAAGAVAVIALVGVVAWRLARTTGSGAAPAETASVSGTPAAAPATLAGAASRASAPPPPASPAANPTASTARLLRGRLTGVAAPLAGPVRVRVRALGDWGKEPEGVVTGEATLEGGFALDVRAFVDGAKELDVRVDAPEYLPALARVPIPAPPGELAEVVVAMRRAGVLSGRVVTEEGTPVPGALVGLFPAEPGLGAEPIDAVRCGPDGAYRLRTAADGVHLVAADADDLRPAWRRESVLVGKERVAPDLVLARGAAIAGTAHAPALGRSPLAVHVTAASQGPSLLVQDAQESFSRSLSWDGERLEKGDLEVRVGSRGQFRATGLAPGAYRLALDRDDDVEPRVRGAVFVHQDLARALVREVVAPASGVDLVLEGGLLRVEVSGPSGPAAKASLSVSGVNEAEAGESTGMFGLSTDDAGNARLLVRPGAEYDVEARVDGLRTERRRIRAPARGAEVVERFALEPDASEARAPFVVTLIQGEGKPVDVEVAQFRLRRDETDGDEVWSGRVKPEVGRFLLAGAPAGRWRLSTTTAGILVGGSVPWLEATTVVEVPREGGGQSAVRLTLGGLLVVSAVAPDGRRLGARCRVLDARGERVRGWFAVRLGGGAAMGGPSTLSAVAPAQFEPPLPAGTYALELSEEGFADQRIETVVRAGETTTVEARLAAK